MGLSGLLEVVFDPFVHFCVGCIAAPLFANKNMTNEKMIEYFVHPSMLGSAAALVLAFVIARVGKTAPLS